MEHEREEESRVMFSLNDSGESMPCDDVATFTVQGLRDALMAAESTVAEPPCPVEEFIIQLESNDSGSTRMAVPTSLLLE